MGGLAKDTPPPPCQPPLLQGSAATPPPRRTSWPCVAASWPPDPEPLAQGTVRDGPPGTSRYRRAYQTRPTLPPPAERISPLPPVNGPPIRKEESPPPPLRALGEFKKYTEVNGHKCRKPQKVTRQSEHSSQCCFFSVPFNWCLGLLHCKRLACTTTKERLASPPLRRPKQPQSFVLQRGKKGTFCFSFEKFTPFLMASCFAGSPPPPSPRSTVPGQPVCTISCPQT